MVSIVWCSIAQVLRDVQTIHLYLQGQIGLLKDPKDLSFEAQNPLKYYEVRCLPIKGERSYQDYFGEFFLRVILRFIFHLETILKTIYSENSCQIENSPQNSLQTENEP